MQAPSEHVRQRVGDAGVPGIERHCVFCGGDLASHGRLLPFPNTRATSLALHAARSCQRGGLQSGGWLRSSCRSEAKGTRGLRMPDVRRGRLPVPGRAPRALCEAPRDPALRRRSRIHRVEQLRPRQPAGGSCNGGCASAVGLKLGRPSLASGIHAAEGRSARDGQPPTAPRAKGSAAAAKPEAPLRLLLGQLGPQCNAPASTARDGLRG
mmetsp:Transcript_36928/g.102571  ORF Transcript_36928/g.102571 Transcript_36928/m.102571 type:complete len:210 (-) Transcript_36928:1144-1773(-)